MAARSQTACSWGTFIFRLALALALVLIQGAAAGPVIAQEGAPELVEAQIDFDALSPDLETAEIEITTAASATRGVVDTLIDQYPSNANNNYDFDSALVVGFGNNYRQRSLIEPSLSKIPPHAAITSATLRLYFCGYREFIGETRTVTFFRVTSPWHQSLATWNHAPTTGEPVGSFNVSIPNGIPTPIPYDLNVTSQVQNWVNGANPNYGLMMTGMEGQVHGTHTFLQFCSSDTNYRPQLIINYTPTVPTLGSTPSTLAFAYDSSKGLPNAQALMLNNNGSTIFNWQAADNATWLNLSPSSGTVGPGSSQSISVTVDPTGYGAGRYNGLISLTSSTPGVVGFPRSVAVTMSVASLDHGIMLPLVRKGGTSTTATRDVATLIIGISDYLHLEDLNGGSSERAGAWGEDLDFAGLDSTKETRTLSVFGLHHAANECNCGDGAVAGGITPSSLPAAAGNILTLTDTEATLENIQAAIAWLDGQEGPNTTVQIFYSGHGGQTYDVDGDETQAYDDLDEFITAYDTNYNEGTGEYTDIITDEMLNAWLDSLESTKVAVILDSCFSGGMMGPGAVDQSALIGRGLPIQGGAGASTPAIDPAIDLASDLAKTGRDILTASAATEVSYEDPYVQQGVFSYFLMAALLDPTADSDNNTIITVAEAYNYLYSRVYSYTSNTQSPQFYGGVAGSVGLSWATDATAPCR